MAYRPKISAPLIVGRPSEGHVVLRRPINVVPRSGPPNSKLSQEERLDEALAIAKKSVALDHLDALRFTHGRALLAHRVYREACPRHAIYAIETIPFLF